MKQAIIYIKPGWVHSKPPPNPKRVREANVLLVPLFFSTLFPITRYQIEADYGEWCCYFCEISPPFCENEEKYSNFSFLHRSFTAFAYRIRSPPFRLNPANHPTRRKEIPCKAKKLFYIIFLKTGQNTPSQHQ